MVLKLIKTNYSYECILSLANKDVMMKDIEDEINESYKEFNIYARTSTKNKKRISSCKIDEDEDLLIIILDSENPLPIPVRGLKYFTQLLIEHLDGEDGKKDKEGVLLLEKICKKKSFFRTVSIKEIKKEAQNENSSNFKLEKSEKIEEWDDSKIPTSDIVEKFHEISIIEADKVIRDLFYNTEIRGNAEEKAKDEILRVVEKYLIEKGMK